MNRNLTEAQAMCLTALMKLTAKKGFPPSLRELSEHLGYSTVRASENLILALRDKGYVEFERGHARSYRVVLDEHLRPVKLAYVRANG